MQKLIRMITLGIALQASVFALEVDILEEQGPAMSHQSESSIETAASHSDSSGGNHCCKHYGPRGPQGPIGPQGYSGKPFGNYASFFLTTSSGDVDVNPGENVIFNDQVTLSGIQYDSATGVFTLSPGTYAVTYFFAPFSIPSVNMYVNGQLILNSPLGGSSTVLTLTEPTNTLVLQYISLNSFSVPGANESWASIAILQID